MTLNEVIFVKGDRVSFSKPVSRDINISRGGDRLGLAFVSKAERPFGLVQAAGSGVILLRSCVLVVKGDQVSARWFLWGAISVPVQRQSAD
jgi:hypothetical protein